MEKSVNHKLRNFYNKYIIGEKISPDVTHHSRGGMMLEILLSLAIAAAALPFVLRQLDNRTHRAENVSIARDIAMTRDALERYMDARKRELLAPTGSFVTRVKMRDLIEYGNIPKNYDKFQARIIKSRDANGHAVLSGMVIFDSADISPVRTREIAELGGQGAGFVERNEAYSAFGTWRSKTSIFDAQFGKDSVVESTDTILSGGDFLWRLPSNEPLDGSMASDFSMGGNNINDAKQIDAYSADFSEILHADLISARKVQITPRANFESALVVSGEALVMGAMTSDSRNATIGSEVFLTGQARISRLDTGELWVGDLNLNGLSIGGSEKPGILKVGQTIDITRGRITARTATIGYSGSVAPKISVTERIEDSGNQAYYWDLKSGDAKFFDVSAGQLNQMMKNAIRAESKSPKTTTETIINQVAANNNATISDYARALGEIQSKVMMKYNRLKLEQAGVK